MLVKIRLRAVLFPTQVLRLCRPGNIRRWLDHLEVFGQVSRCNVVSIRQDIISRAELRSLHASQIMAIGMVKGVTQKAQRIAERIRNGAIIEECGEIFDIETLTVVNGN